MAEPGVAAWLGIDIGTQSVRAVVVDDDGTILGSGARSLTSVRVGERHEQDAETWWAATAAAVAAALSTVDGRSVRGLSVASTSGTVVVVDEQGRPTTPGIMYDDGRGAGLLREVTDVGADVFARSGYRVQATWALPKLVWLRRNGLLADGCTVLHQGDLVLRRLAGRALPTDTSTALKAGVDLVAGEWCTSALHALDIPREALPDLVDPGTVVGTVDAAVAASLGLGRRCAVVSGMTDGCAAQIAAGAVAPGHWNTAMGTTMVVKGVSDALITDPTGVIYSHRAPFGAAWLPGGASSTGTQAFAHWLPAASLDELSGQASTYDDPPLIYPLVGTGERFPFVDPQAHAVFESRFEGAGSVERFAAIAHGIAYLERLAYESLSHLGFAIDGPIGLTGGGARNRWWNQLRSDVLGRAVRVPANAEGAVGMSVLAAAAVAGNERSPDRLAPAAERMLGPGQIIEPRPETAARHDEAYRRFVAMLAGAGFPVDAVAP